MQDSSYHTLLLPLKLVAASLRYVQAQTLGAEVYLVVALLQDASNGSGVLKLSEVDVTAALLDGISNQFCRAGLTLCADDHSLLLLTCFVDNECCSLCILLRDLLCFNSGGELGGECKVLSCRQCTLEHYTFKAILTVRETSSRRRLNRVALRVNWSRTSLETFSLCVIN